MFFRPPSTRPSPQGEGETRAVSPKRAKKTTFNPADFYGNSACCPHARVCFLPNGFRRKARRTFSCGTGARAARESGSQPGIVADAAVCSVEILAEDAWDGQSLGIADGIRGEHLPDSGLHLQRQPGDFAARFPEENPENAPPGIGNAEQRKKRYLQTHGYL